MKQFGEYFLISVTGGQKFDLSGNTEEVTSLISLLGRRTKDSDPILYICQRRPNRTYIRNPRRSVVHSSSRCDSDVPTAPEHLLLRDVGFD